MLPGIFAGAFQANFQTLTSLRRCCQEVLALLCPEPVPGVAPVSMFLYTASGTAMSTWYYGVKVLFGAQVLRWARLILVTSSLRLSLFILWHLMVTRGSTEPLLSWCLIWRPEGKVPSLLLDPGRLMLPRLPRLESRCRAVFLLSTGDLNRSQNSLVEALLASTSVLLAHSRGTELARDSIPKSGETTEEEGGG